MSKVRIIKDQVRKILVRRLDVRDDDSKLQGLIWYRELIDQGVPKDLAKQFVQIVADGKLTNPESIRRSRAALQRDFPELRGKLYEKRKGREVEIRTDLGYASV